jgi:hypothetical protein
MDQQYIACMMSGAYLADEFKIGRRACNDHEKDVLGGLPATTTADPIN